MLTRGVYVIAFSYRRAAGQSAHPYAGQRGAHKEDLDFCREMLPRSQSGNGHLIHAFSRPDKAIRRAGTVFFS
jgi:hypothetical protein